jgi:hypothetical protein
VLGKQQFCSITYSAGWKQDEQIKAGTIKITVSERFLAGKNGAENWGSGCMPFLHFADFGGQAQTKIKH